MTRGLTRWQGATKMNWILNVLFDLDGRITRTTWLVFYLGLSIAESLTGHFFRGMFGISDVAGAGISPEAYFEDRAALLSALIFLWPSIALDVKRWHDMGKSGWLTLVAYAPLLAIYLFEELKDAGVIAARPLPGGLFSTMGLVFLIYLIVLAARKGTPAANQYGAAA